MINSVVEAPSRPIAEPASKPDQQTDGSGFMSMLAGMVSGQPGLAGQTQQSSDAADAASSSTGADQAGSVTMAALAGTESGGQSQATEQAGPGLVDTAKTKQAEVPTPPVVTEQTDSKPAVAESNKQGAIRALESLTTVRADGKALPEAAKPASEMAASMVAYRLNPMGQNSQSGAVLPQMDSQSQTKEAGSDGPAKNIAAAAIAGSKKPEQAPADAGTRIAVEWKPTEPVTISASNGGFRDTLQFANGNTGQSEPKDLSAGNNTQQAFGVEMKAQLGTDTILRQAQTAPAQTPQMDPTLGEKMVGQIVREVTLHKLGENTTLSIRLDPPELGTLRISVTSQSGTLTTQLESPSAVVRGILETHLPALKDALANAGVEVSKFSVSSGLDFGAHAQKQQQAWQPTRMAPAVEFNPRMEDQQSVIEAAASGNQTSTASYSWLA